MGSKAALETAVGRVADATGVGAPNNFAAPLLLIERCHKRASDAAAIGDYDAALRFLAAIEVSVGNAQIALRAEQKRKAGLEERHA